MLGYGHAQYGRTPFKGGTRRGTFANILEKRLSVPDQPPVSSPCRNLIRKLLTKNERKRLGSQHGASDVKEHPFFAGISWPRAC